MNWGRREGPTVSDFRHLSVSKVLLSHGCHFAIGSVPSFWLRRTLACTLYLQEENILEIQGKLFIVRERRDWVRNYTTSASG